MRYSAKRAAWIMGAAGLASACGSALGADDRSVHRHAGGAWWDTETCCAHKHLWAPEERRRAAFDEQSGRSLLNYPPHRFADHRHMKLELTIADMNTPRLEARQTLTLAPLGMELPELVLDCAPQPMMEIRSVSIPGGGARKVAFEHADEELRMSFDPPVPDGERFEVVIEYTLNNPSEGMTWTPETAAWPGRPAQLHTQGQPESNHYWFPCHDSPNERLTTEIVATVPSGFTVVSNGKLVERKSAGASETFHWLQDKDHVNYLVTLVVGKFDVVDVGTTSLPMPVYAPLGQGRNVDQTYGRTPAMVRRFETLLDEPFPWDKYAQVIVHNFAAGGMENTSATSMFDTAVLDKTALMDGDLDGLISHELAHQWFGDLMTCNSWEFIWLNEGFATYFTHVWFEERDGVDAYLSGMHGTFRGVARADRADAPFQPAMCSKEYEHPWETFRRAANPYPKGASVLHMLRTQLGDTIFFNALRLYVDRVKGRTVENDDLRYAFEQASGRSFDRFFRQWCMRPGVPHVQVTPTWDSASGTLKVDLKQTQTIDGYNPTFFFTLPIWVQTTTGPREGQWLEIAMDGREASKTFQLPGDPVVFAVNANLAVLADVTVEQSPARWVAQLTSGPTIASKLDAIEALRQRGAGGEKSAEAGETLAALVRNGQAFHELRRAAAAALADVGGDDVYLRAFRTLPDDARVRSGLVGAAGGVYESIKSRADNSPARFLDDLRQVASKDPSYGVRAAAIRQLGDIGGAESRGVIVASLDVPSQNDQIRGAALDALAAMDEKESLALALKYIGEGTPARTRPQAIQAAAALAHHDPERAVAALAPLLQDRSGRVVRSAGDALISIGGPAADKAIEEYAASARTAMARSTAAEWARRVRERSGS